MLQVKKILNDIIEHAYPNSENSDQYKKFYVEVLDKNLKSKHGDYNGKNHHIRIFNLYRADSTIIATTIHELSHHIDYVNRGTTDHSNEFYEIFQHLLYTSLNMKLFNKEEFLKANRDASDSNKIAKLISEYVPENVGYKSGMNKIIVRNCYDIKDRLKENGFSYNKVNHTWEKELSDEDVTETKDLLESLDAEYEMTDANSLSFEKKVYIGASKGSYDVREELKQEGFYYYKKGKIWRREVEKSQLNNLLNEYKQKYPEVIFEIC